jgi:hypothetical protein
MPLKAGDRRRMRGTATAIFALAAAAACRDRGERAEDGGGARPPDTVYTSPRTVDVRLLTPRNVAWNGQDTLVVAVTNGTGRPLADAALEVFVQSPVEVLADSAAPDSARPRLVSSGEGTRLTFALGPMQAGARAEVRQGLRMPPAPAAPPPAGGAIPRSPDGRFVARAWVASGGEPVSAVAMDTIRIRPGSETVLGGCAEVKNVSVSRYGVGPVRLGMTAAALRSACPDARDTTWLGDEGMRERGLGMTLSGTPLLAVLAGDSVQRIVVDSAGVRTAAGAGVGSRLADLRTRYGRMCAGLGEGRVAVWFPNAPGISFALDSADTRGWTPPAPPDSLADTARVASFWVRQGADDCPRGGG